MEINYNSPKGGASENNSVASSSAASNGTKRVARLSDHLGGLSLNPTKALLRETTALQPNLFDKDRKVLPCKSMNERESWLKYFTSFQPEKDEGEYEAVAEFGEIPSFLLGGSFIRNGPGLFERGNVRIHMADGDGLLVKMVFQDKKRVKVMGKYLNTPEYEKEKKAGAILYRGSYGTSQVQKPTVQGAIKANVGNLDWKVTGNTNHLFWNNEFYALHEIGLPIKVDFKTLNVIETNCRLKDDALGAMEPFSAHYRIDPIRNTLINFGIDYRAERAGPHLLYWEFDKEMNLLHKHLIRLKLRTIAHSFAATENYLIQFFSPVKVNMMGLMYVLGWGVDDSMYHDWQAECAYIFVLHRRKGGVSLKNTDKKKEESQGIVYKCINWWPNHHVTAFEDGNGDLVLDSCMYERKTTGWIEREPFDLPKTRLVRFRMKNHKRRDENGFHNIKEYKDTPLFAEHEILYNGDCEMPIINPAREMVGYRYVYLVDLSCSKMSNQEAEKMQISHRFGEALYETPWSGLIKVDLKNNSVQKYHPQMYCGEVAFVANPNGKDEDDGCLINLCFDPVQCISYLMIFDAKDITKGPICRIRLNSHIPFSFHCGYLPFA